VIMLYLQQDIWWTDKTAGLLDFCLDINWLQR